MNYEKFIKRIEQVPAREVPAEVWSRIIHTVEKKQPQAGIIYLLRNTALAAAVVVVILVVSLNVYQRSVVDSYLQYFGNTDYLYDIWKYPG